MRDRVVRVGIIGGWPASNPAIEVHCRVRQPLVLVVPAGNPLSGRTEVRLVEVAEAAIPLYVVAWTTGLRPLVAEALRSLQPAQAVVEIPFEMARRFMLGGSGATFATRAMVAADVAAGLLHTVPVVDMPPLYYENVVVSLKGAVLPRVVSGFVDLVCAEAKAMSVQPP